MASETSWITPHSGEFEVIVPEPRRPPPLPAGDVVPVASLRPFIAAVIACVVLVWVVVFAARPTDEARESAVHTPAAIRATLSTTAASARIPSLRARASTR